MTTPHLNVAPMMDWTDRHCRYFHRLLSPSAQLYTEMVTAAAIEHGDCDMLLAYDAAEQPLAVQLGGSDVRQMTHAARVCAARGFNEININVGCPSDRVQSGQFGACLMASPHKVADCFASMRDAVDVPVTIKTRIGIDDNDSYDYLRRFIDTLTDVGCERFIVHARIAILKGLSPKQNRSVPPLNYPRVLKLKADLPHLNIVMNGGITSLGQVRDLLQQVDGVMIGRKAYQDPYFLTELESLVSGAVAPSRPDVVQRMLPYIGQQLSEGQKLHRITRHMLGLFSGQPGARRWRRVLSENSHKEGAGLDLLKVALEEVSACM